MASHFKCLVKINCNKYSIIIDNKDNEDIGFDQIYQKIKSIDNNLNISSNTHLFEVLDKDFDEYVVITDKKQIIKNLSRIRVSQKSTKSSVNPKSSHEKSEKSSKPHNSSVESNKSMDDLNRDLLKNLFMPRLTSEDMKAFNEMTLSIELNSNRFLENPKNTGNWVRISNALKKKGFDRNKYKPKQCQQLFFSYGTTYKQLLEYSPNSETASKYFPLFKCFHSMDLKPLYSKKAYKQIVLMKEKFDLKNNSSKSETNDKTRSNTPEVEKVSNKRHFKPNEKSFTSEKNEKSSEKRPKSNEYLKPKIEVIEID